VDNGWAEIYAGQYWLPARQRSRGLVSDHRPGTTWIAVADPCAASRFPGSLFSRMATDPAGTLWVVCASEPAAGSMPKDLVVSPDGGASWRGRGQLESGEYATDIYPFSAQIAWRTDGRAPLLHTTDGVDWTVVATSQVDAFGGFVAINGQTAVYADLVTGIPRPSSSHRTAAGPGPRTRTRGPDAGPTVWVDGTGWTAPTA
jgi:hypothetical protein